MTSRFRYFPGHGTAPAAPGKCIITGMVDDLVDLDISLQHYGAVYINAGVIRELAEVCGVLDLPKEGTLALEEARLDGYAQAVQKDFDGTLRGLVFELAGAADRLERVQALAAAETSDVGEHTGGEPEGGAAAEAPAGSDRPALTLDKEQRELGEQPDRESDNPFADLLRASAGQ